MICKELLRRGHAALIKCTHQVETGDEPSLCLGLAEVCDCLAGVGAGVPCIARRKHAEECCDCQCTELRDAYRAGLLAFLGVARCWAECSQPFIDKFATIALNGKTKVSSSADNRGRPLADQTAAAISRSS